MKKKIYILEIEIWGIEVEETDRNRGWYKFEYALRANKGKKILGEMDGSWSSQTKTQFRRKLNNGWASQLVFQKIK